MTPGTPAEDPSLEADAEQSLGKAPAAPSVHAAKPAAAPPAQAIPGLFTAGHEILFEPTVSTCDACDGPLLAEDGDGDASQDDDDAGGHGLYIWARSSGLVYETPPLCAACAAAITISALQRWDIEEEEG